MFLSTYLNFYHTENPYHGIYISNQPQKQFFIKLNPIFCKQKYISQSFIELQVKADRFYLESNPCFASNSSVITFGKAISPLQMSAAAHAAPTGTNAPRKTKKM